MELVTKVNCRIVARARLEEDGSIDMTLSGIVEYGDGRTATASIDVPTEKTAAVAIALKNLVEEFAPAVGERAMRIADQAKAVAIAQGEM